MGIGALIPAQCRISAAVLAPLFGLISAELSHRKRSFGSSSKHAEIGQESFGLVVCRSVGTVPDILGLIWPRFRPHSGSKSKISGRILQNVRGPFGSAELFVLFGWLGSWP